MVNGRSSCLLLKLHLIPIQAAEFTILNSSNTTVLCFQAVRQVNITFSQSWRIPVSYLSYGLTSTKTAVFTVRVMPRSWSSLCASRIDSRRAACALILLAHTCLRWTRKESSSSRNLRGGDLSDIGVPYEDYPRGPTRKAHKPNICVLLKSNIQLHPREWLLPSRSGKRSSNVRQLAQVIFTMLAGCLVLQMLFLNSLS